MDGLPFDKERELVDFYVERLEFIWPRWLAFINLMVFFPGATVLLFLNSLKALEPGRELQEVPWAAATIVLASLSLLGGIYWRAMAQQLMESEILGSEAGLARYFKTVGSLQGVRYGPFLENPAVQRRRRVRYYIGWVASVGLLVASWGAGLVFILRNLGG